MPWLRISAAINEVRERPMLLKARMCELTTVNDAGILGKATSLHGVDARSLLKVLVSLLFELLRVNALKN